MHLSRPPLPRLGLGVALPMWWTSFVEGRHLPALEEAHRLQGTFLARLPEAVEYTHCLGEANRIFDAEHQCTGCVGGDPPTPPPPEMPMGPPAFRTVIRTSVCTSNLTFEQFIVFTF